jgi:hypothetical protein
MCGLVAFEKIERGVERDCHIGLPRGRSIDPMIERMKRLHLFK